MGQNFNLVCVNATKGKQRYVGHGTSSEGYSEEEIAAMMVASYNVDPNHFFKVSSDDQKRALEEFKPERFVHLKRRTDNPLQEVDGFNPTSPQDFRVHLIYELVMRPVDQVDIHFVRQYAAKHFGPLYPQLSEYS
jgi:hypothetical protein